VSFVRRELPLHAQPLEDSEPDNLLRGVFFGSALSLLFFWIPLVLWMFS
jgi:hypothetical protein